MTVLIHNTTLAKALLIVIQRRVLSRVVDGKYNYLSGPFFYVAGQNGTEVITGGKDAKVWLSFECALPSYIENRSRINQIENTGSIEIDIPGKSTKRLITLSALRGNIVQYKNDVSGAIEQATIIPKQTKCLKLVAAKAPMGIGRILLFLAGKEHFDVTMIRPVLMPDGKAGA
jgi:hypothetical protein